MTHLQCIKGSCVNMHRVQRPSAPTLKPLYLIVMRALRRCTEKST